MQEAVGSPCMPGPAGNRANWDPGMTVMCSGDPGSTEQGRLYQPWVGTSNHESLLNALYSYSNIPYLYSKGYPSTFMPYSTEPELGFTRAEALPTVPYCVVSF